MAIRSIYSLSDTLNFGKKMLGTKCVKDMTIREILDYGEDGYAYIAWCFNDVKGFKLDNKAFLYAKLKETEITKNRIGAKAKQACTVSPYEVGMTFPKVQMGEYGALEHDLRGDADCDEMQSDGEFYY